MCNKICLTKDPGKFLKFRICAPRISMDYLLGVYCKDALREHCPFRLRCYIITTKWLHFNFRSEKNDAVLTRDKTVRVVLPCFISADLKSQWSHLQQSQPSKGKFCVNSVETMATFKHCSTYQKCSHNLKYTWRMISAILLYTGLSFLSKQCWIQF